MNKDFTDFYLLFLNTGRISEFETAFNELVKNAKDIKEAYPELFEDGNIFSKDHEYQEVDFYESIKQKYIDKPICFSALVRGEAAKPYICPSEIKFTCDTSKGDACLSCSLFHSGGKMLVNIESMNPLELIDCTEQQKIGMIKKKTGISQCARFDIEVIKQRYIQEIFLSPLIKYSDERKEQRFIVRHAYSDGAILIPNKAYKFYAIPMASPRNQSLVYYIKKSEEEENDLDTFKLSEKDMEDLKIFQPEDGSIQNKLNDIYNDLSVNLSPAIRYRDDIYFAVDLAFHSAISFYFGKSFEKKGWVDCLIVGDTSVGKSKVTEKLINHYRLGVIQGSESSTIAGLIGGMTRFESINIMTWGLLPSNNARLVALDEMSGIKKEVFGEMTRIRSEGIAERTIVGGPSSTHSKVRLIWLSNPRRRSIKLYDSGCDMVKDLVGLDEDISRFDFVLVLAEDEVTSEQINSFVSTGNAFLTKHKYKSDLCNKLVLWAWSRKANNITFDDGVEKLILECSIEMAKRYTSSFPLVLASTIRLKLSRLSIALAARLFSTEDGVNIIVKEEHVDYIFYWLNKIYCKPSFGYGEYSEYFMRGERDSENAKDKTMLEIREFAKDWRLFVVNMLKNPRITALEIRDFLGCAKEKADEIRSDLVSNGYLVKKMGFYVKSDMFRKILKKELKG